MNIYSIVFKNYKSTLIFLILFLVLFYGITAYFGFQKETWGDEGHFVRTINYFEDGITLNKLKHYNEMSGPLPFIIYSWWGKLFSYDLNILRLLSLLIAFCTYLLSFQYLYKITGQLNVALFSTLFISLHPYMVGISIFVFTDMLPIFGMILTLLAIYKKNYILYGIGIVLAILSRQYYVFFLLGVIIFYLINWFKNRDVFSIKILITSFVGSLPQVFLILLWEGSSPINDLKELYVQYAFTYHINYLTLYILQISVYLLPFLLWKRKLFYYKAKIWGIALILSTLYFFFPVRPCQASLNVGIQTVGYFHKLLNVFHLANYTDILFYIFYLLSLPVLINMFFDLGNLIKQKRINLKILYIIIILMFYMIMPLSYLLWEKYFIPIMIIWILYFVTDNNEKLIKDLKSNEAGRI